MEGIIVNESKNFSIQAEGVCYGRIPIRTHVIMPGEEWKDILDQYLSNVLLENDIVFIAESVVAIIQNRVFKVEDIKPRKLAVFLSKLVHKNSGGIGLTNPEMMEVAFREAGTARILLSAVISAIGKLFGKKGWFYLVAGCEVRDIDGPDSYTLPPYNNCVVLAPESPDLMARSMKQHLNHDVMIVDINDLGQNVLGNSSDLIPNELIAKILRDNPLGQSNEQTPIGIIRRIKNN